MSNTPRKIPATAGETTAEQPWPVRLLSSKLTDYVSRSPAVWVEGQVVQLTRRPGQTTCYLTLRDPDVDLSFNVSVHVRVLDALPTPLQDGSRVVMRARAQLFPRRGSLSLFAEQIRPVGVGELLAQLDHLRRLLTAEGLFSADRKRPLPFLPNVVGLICGRASAAERDVVENARRRWPAVRFEIRAVAVQGPKAVEDVVGALRSLDADPTVDVVVVARGGGSVEDLLPFSNEALLRVVSACRTPIVSAIGHEVDKPLLDLVADVAASTPTDAGKRIVPDMEAELNGIRQTRRRARQAVTSRLQREAATIASLRSRPVLADPHRLLTDRSDLVTNQRERAARALANRLSHAHQDVGHLRQRVRALSPLATMERGYAVVSGPGGQVVRSAGEISPGDPLRIRVHEGEFAAEARALGSQS
ncbi:exodeoxyribonuclease VII large subunit [Kineosporia sp. NBRC 101731]|uniref:exodeoxyribonuclease VII large subunit n=1 Tax=Kineosporia sp. NBRC 101731 TaxID=3032199 RepID=UPI0024A4EB0F|nr:exodeoxyribonuclease VII large subunit [Kineosporia sp. NBRC 101731]GLY28596.1 exodeoxyribonuclease 7 large subunit [Kineosporia sp. NBRC 101731]